MRTMIWIALAMALLPGCRVDCIQGTGPVEERILELAPFHALDLGGSMGVTIEQGPAQQVVVTAQPEVIDLLRTEVSGGVWEIGTKACWNSAQGIRIRITTPAELTSIDVAGSAEVDAGNVFSPDHVELSTSGSGTIRVAELNTKQLDLQISGSGSITVRGTCAALDGELTGSGEMHAVDLAANTVELTVTGSGGATVTAISTLHAEVSGSGSVRYGGKPQLHSTITGSGSVTPLP